MLLLAGNWWSFVLRGVLAILFSAMTFFLPGMALLTLVYLFGFYAIADGVFNIAGAVRRTGPNQVPWWALLIEGIFGIIAGLIALSLPGMTAIILLYVIAGWALATGIMKIVASIRLRKQVQGEWVLALSGAISIVLSILIAIFPGAGVLALVLWIGAYALVFGVLLIILGMRMRSWTRREERLGHDLPHHVVPGH